MIPLIDMTLNEIQETEYQDKTYKIIVSDDRVSGYTESIEAVKQAIYLILNTERYKYPLYSWDYGVELFDLFGKPMSYVTAELKRRIEEALIQDNRIERVSDFEFEIVGKGKLHTTFIVHTIYGSVGYELEVSV